MTKIHLQQNTTSTGFICVLLAVVNCLDIYFNLFCVMVISGPRSGGVVSAPALQQKGQWLVSADYTLLMLAVCGVFFSVVFRSVSVSFH